MCEAWVGCIWACLLADGVAPSLLPPTEACGDLVTRWGLEPTPAAAASVAAAARLDSPAVSRLGLSRALLTVAGDGAGGDDFDGLLWALPGAVPVLLGNLFPAVSAAVLASCGADCSTEAEGELRPAA